MNTTTQLQTDIENALGRKLQTPKDFDFLRERIYARQHMLISRTTLMRIWGYVEEDVKPRKSTLNILTQFLGYRDWNEYLHNSFLPKEQQSSPVLNRRLSVAKVLNIGDRLRLTWQPKRVCDIEYMGELRFRVVDSVNTRLHEGDTFECSLIIEGEPLYLDNVRQEVDGKIRSAIAYVCGKQSGVMYEYLPR